MDLKKWIEVDSERVLFELTKLLEHLDVTIGRLDELRDAVDNTRPADTTPPTDTFDYSAEPMELADGNWTTGGINHG